MKSGVWDEDSSNAPYQIQGNWDADTNTPDLLLVTTVGYAWTVSIAGNTNLDGITNWLLGDTAVKTSTGWAKVSASNATWGNITGLLADQIDLLNALALKANDSDVVKLTGNQTIHDTKTFHENPIIPTPTLDLHPVTKKYTDDGLALKQNRPTTAIENNIAVFNATKDTKDSSKAFTTSLTVSPSDIKVPTEKAVTDVLIPLLIKTYNELSTGIKSGFAITINADNTKIDIASGLGLIVNNDDPTQPYIVSVSCPECLAITLTNLATSNATYLAIDSTGTLIQQTSPYTALQRRSLILLGVAIHSNRTIVNAINNLPDISLSSQSQLNDLMDGLRGFNVTGNIISANGANLFINKSLGYLFKKGSNFRNDINNPHVLTLQAQVAPSNIRYRLRNGTEYANTNSVDPDNYDLNNVLTPVSPNKFTIQHIVLFTSGLIRIQYGQTLYGSLSEATQAISTETFIEEQNMAENGLLRCLLVVKQGTTDLSNINNVRFFEPDRFGSTKLTGSGAGTTTLQQAYNNSIKPQILTDSIGTSFQIKRGSASDNDAVFEILNGNNEIVGILYGNATSFGNITTGHYFKVEADGTVVLMGNATAYDDISLSGLSFSAGGASAPDLINFVNSNCITYGFDGNATTERLYLTTEMHHDYMEGTDLELHIHWAPSTANLGNVKWQIYYTWQNKDGTFETPVLLPVISEARGVAWQNTYASFGMISGLNKVINSQLLLQVFRVPTDGEDTYPDNAAFIAFGIHYKKDGFGSRTITAK